MRNALAPIQEKWDFVAGEHPRQDVRMGIEIPQKQGDLAIAPAIVNMPTDFTRAEHRLFFRSGALADLNLRIEVSREIFRLVPMLFDVREQWSRGKPPLPNSCGDLLDMELRFRQSSF